MLRQPDEDIDDDFEEIEEEAPPPIPIPDEVIVPIGPQPGPQMMFATSEADIIVFGGAAGGGKTGGLLLECTRHTSVPGFSFTIFRRSTPQITNQGGLWDESYKFFPHAGGVPRNHDHSWHFPEHGTKGRFTHLEYEDTVYDYDGAQIPLIGFDQLEQFTEKQFFYMLTRNRTTCGVRPYIRATANPPPTRDHWLRNLVDWWIGEDGYPIAERSGVVRYFIRVEGKILWVDKDYKDAKGVGPKSFTFIPAKLSDNPILMNADPGYAANLAAQSHVDRLRLEGGNWNAVDGGTMFLREWFTIIEPHEVPRSMRRLRYWDRAATEATEKNPNPDFTAGALCGVDKDGILYIIDMQHFQESPAGNEKRISETAAIDGKHRVIYLEEEGGSSGKDVISYYQRIILKGYIVVGDRPSGDKKVRAKPWCGMSQNGNVKIVRGSWNHNFLAEIESYPNGKKDQVDAVSGAYKFLIGKGKGSTRDLVSQEEE